MAIIYNLKSGGCLPESCQSKDGCPPGVCPDFTIRRHDNKPPLKVAIENCDGALDLRGLVVEVNMWAVARLKAALAEDGEYFRLADDIGFEQVMVGDVIVMDRARLPEHMLVLAFDEDNKLIKVQRGYHGTTPGNWKKGTKMRIFRIMGGVAEAEIVLEDQQNIDGTTEKDVITESYLVYEWQAQDTCLPGCYWLEFKVLKMIDTVWYLPGGNWTGEVHTGTDGFFYTGTAASDSSVKLSWDQLNELYLIPDTVWPGEIHLHSDSNYYTGSTHDSGSVLLAKTGVPAPATTAYNQDGLVALAASVIPSFTDESLTPEDFGCKLGDGVEWVRRYPTTGEGFLIKVENSFTTEL